MFANLYKRIICLVCLILLAKTIAPAQNISVTIGSPATIPPDYFGYNGANLNRPGQPSFDTPWLMDSIASLYPLALRYPAGLLANYWDWQRGYLKKDLPEGWVLPDNYSSLTKSNSLSQFRSMLNRNALAPVMALNLLCSNKEYETAELFAAKGLNIPVKYLEFGSELYHDYKNYYEVFPTAESYTTTANEWAAYMKSIPGMSDLKIGIVGATNRNEPDYSRRNTWTEKVAATAGSNIDAINLHYYIGSGFMKEVESVAKLSYMLSNPFSAYQSNKEEFDLIRNAGKEIWITEYNLVRPWSLLSCT